MKDKKEREYIPFKDFDGKWGFRDKDWKVLITALYESVEPFEGDYAKAVIHGDVIYLDRRGGWHKQLPEPSDDDDDDETPSHRSPLDILMDGFSRATNALHKGLDDLD